MKKLFALMMVAGFAVAIVACGGKTDTASGEVDSSTVAPDTTVAPAADTTVTDTTGTAAQ